MFFESCYVRNIIEFIHLQLINKYNRTTSQQKQGKNLAYNMN